MQTWFNTTPDPQRTELAVFCFGTNDAVLGVPLGDSLAALGRALDRAEELSVPVFLIGPPPIGDMPTEDRALKTLSEMVGAIAEEKAIPFVPTFDALGPDSIWGAEAGAGDGSHPGAGGYAEMADLLVRGGLVEWLTKTAYG